MDAIPAQAMPLPVGLVFGAVGLVLLAVGGRDVWRAVRYRARRPVPVGQLAGRSGRVLVSGVARRADDVLEAPLSGRSCLAYAWRVAESREQRGLDGSIGTWGERGASHRSAVPFLVDDGTGQVLVGPTGARLHLAEERIDDPAAIPDDDGDEEPTLREVADGVLGVRTYDRRFYESRLDEGETVTVRGRVTTADEPLDARRIGISITGGGTVVADATPAAAAARALRRAAVSLGAGLFVLVAVAVFVVLPAL